MPRENSIIPKEYQDKPIYSFSRLNAYNTCEYEYYQTYILGLPRKENVYGIMGGFVHNLIEELQQGKITNQQAITEFQNKIFECDILNITFPSEQIKQNFVQCIEHYLNNFKPISCKNYQIELEFYTEIGQSKSVLLGYIDIVILNEDNSIEIYDYKTSSMYDKKAFREHARQLMLYAMAMKNLYGLTPKKIAFNMLKYAEVIYFNGKVEKRIKCQRNKIIKMVQPYITLELKNLKIPYFEIEILVNKCLEDNTFSFLPMEVQKKFQITDCLEEYPINGENIKDLNDYIDNTVSNIELKKNINPKNWLPTDINKQSFYCSVLCNQRGMCEHYRQYREKSQ